LPPFKPVQHHIDFVAFLLRDVMNSTDYAVARLCLSVHSSVTRRYSVETAQNIIKRFHHRVATPLFAVPNAVAIFRRLLPLTPPNDTFFEPIHADPPYVDVERKGV